MTHHQPEVVDDAARAVCADQPQREERVGQRCAICSTRLSRPKRAAPVVERRDEQPTGPERDQFEALPRTSSFNS